MKEEEKQEKKNKRFEEAKKNFQRLLSVEEAAARLGIMPRSIYNGIAPKAKNPFPVKAKRIGRLVKFDIRDLDRYIDSL